MTDRTPLISNTQITPFNFEDHRVRVVKIDGEPWFVAKDVCKVLSIANHKDAVSRLDEDETGGSVLPTPSGPQTMRCVSESGLYALIVTSRKSEAKKFRKWVTAVVLPEIRKTGSYNAATVDLNDPAMLRKTLLNYTEKVIGLQAELADAQPKVAAHDRIAEARGSVCLRDAAKALQMQPKALIEWLCVHRWIYKSGSVGRWCAYQRRIEAGLLEHKLFRFYDQDGVPRISPQCRVTPRGLTLIAQRITAPLLNAASPAQIGGAS